jgi:hypothetical protein
MSSRKYIPLLLTLLTLTGACIAQTWDAKRDFAASNPNGAWAYGSGVTGSSFALDMTYLTQCDAFGDTPGYVCWSGDLEYYLPVVGTNTTGHWLYCCHSLLLPPDVLVMHPAPDWEAADSIVQWTAPVAATYRISGYFEILDAVAPTGVIVMVYRNGTLLVQAELLGPPAQPPEQIGGRVNFYFSQVSFNAGDVISFGVNADGTFYYDSTGFNATIVTPANAPPCTTCSQH